MDRQYIRCHRALILRIDRLPVLGKGVKYPEPVPFGFKEIPFDVYGGFGLRPCFVCYRTGSGAPITGIAIANVAGYVISHGVLLMCAVLRFTTLRAVMD